ncbi:hypothetical protein EU450_10855, partial [Salmonella enterica subsp. enterica serovar Corvallis]|nr:hypothetical protein [Salmonella enterica subsp. enterica serovar Corvallis]
DIKKTQTRHQYGYISGFQSRHLILQVRIKDTAFSQKRQVEVVEDRSQIIIKKSPETQKPYI